MQMSQVLNPDSGPIFKHILLNYMELKVCHLEMAKKYGYRIDIECGNGYEYWFW